MRFRGIVGAAVLVAGLGTSVATASAAPLPAGAHPQAAPTCTRHATTTSALAAAQPGDTVCVEISTSKVVALRTGGQSGKPITYVQNGGKVGGLDVDADHVVVQGFALSKPAAPGIEVHANDVRVENNTITSPTGGDGDGIRFFGNGITISHNTVSNTSNSNGHADCMQTFATDDDDVASQDVTIDGNRCEKVDNMCLIGEGPNSEAGDGSGVGESKNWTFTNNYCQTRKASQTVMLDDVSHVTMTGNTWAAGPDHAIGLQNRSTYATVQNNVLDPSITCEVGIDSSSRTGYQGPTPRCAP